jgi:hypothetical protein
MNRINPALKQCVRCGLVLHRSKFAQRLESKDGLSFWCRGCDRRSWRNRKYAATQQPAEFANDLVLRRDTQCPACQTEWRFDTDRDGALVQICRCGMHYVPVKGGPLPVEQRA